MIPDAVKVQEEQPQIGKSGELLFKDKLFGLGLVL